MTYAELIYRLESLAIKNGVRYKYKFLVNHQFTDDSDDFTGRVLGICHPSKYIEIQKGMPDERTAQTWLHELGHFFQHFKHSPFPTKHFGSEAPEVWSRIEHEADLVAFDVLRRLGFDLTPHDDFAFWNTLDAPNLRIEGTVAQTVEKIATEVGLC